MEVPIEFRVPVRNASSEGYGGDVSSFDWENKSAKNKHYHKWTPTDRWNSEAFQKACEKFGKIEEIIELALPEKETSPVNIKSKKESLTRQPNLEEQERQNEVFSK